jgi:hypothetical protein
MLNLLARHQFGGVQHLFVYKIKIPCLRQAGETSGALRHCANDAHSE